MKSDTDTPSQGADEIRKFFRYGAICTLIWTLLLCGMLVSEDLLEIQEHRRIITGNPGGRGPVISEVQEDSFNKAIKSKMLDETLIFSCIWLIGLGFIWFGTRKIVSTITLLHNERNVLHESEEELRVIFEASESGIVVVTPEGILDFANRRMAEMFGMSLEELIGTPYPDHLHDSEKQVGDERMRLLIKGEIQLVTVDRHYIRSDGTDFWGHLSGRRLEYPDGTLRSLVGVITDISERKRVEEALKESEFFFKESQRSASIGSYKLDFNSGYWESSEVLDNIFGIDKNYNRTAQGWLDIVNPDDREMMDRYLRENVISKRESFSKEYRIVRQIDGETRWVNGLGEVIQDHNGNAISLIGTIHDITERKQAEEERRRLEQQFNHAQKLESLGVLAGGIAHDFNNILTVILGQCFMAREDADPDKSYKPHFQQIETAANRAADLCRQMLTYAGRTEFEQTNLSLRQLVDDSVKMLQSAIKKNVTVELDLKRDVPKIKGDIGQVQQIVMNLIINAVEAVGDDNGTVKVVLSKTVYKADQKETDTFGTVIKAGTYVCLEVSDTGIGMDAETQRRIFEPFYTTKFTGRGLGMSAISGIVKSHDAALKLTSTPGVGTTFRVFFHATEADNEVENAPAASTPSKQAGGTILLVDDEQMLRNMGELLLGMLGFSVITAENGREAVEIYRERGAEIDVILLDLIMPVMGGIEAYHELRKISSAIPIVICSGYSIESVIGTIADDEHAGFMNKPYKPDVLRDVVMKMVE